MLNLFYFELKKVQSPFPNVFFSAPEVVDIRGLCPSTNMKCRGYASDQLQPYGGSRDHASRVHFNDPTTRAEDIANAFGSNQETGQGSPNTCSPMFTMFECSLDFSKIHVRMFDVR